MKYYVTTIDGYVLNLTHTGTKKDFVELDLSQYDFSDDRLYAYKLGKDELIFDPVKYESIVKEKQRVSDLKEINELKQKLNETDYIIARWGEEIIALDNPLTWIADVIKINIQYSKLYAQTILDRKAWRERIEELERGLNVKN